MKVIYIMAFSPMYHYYADENALIADSTYWWHTDTGQVVSAFDRDWAVIIGSRLTATTNQLQYEVWRPDDHADREYSTTLAKGILHRSFPSEYVRTINGLRIGHQIDSPALIRKLINILNAEKVIIMTQVTDKPLTRNIIKACHNKAPVVFTHFVNAAMLLPGFKKTKHPLIRLHYLLIERRRAALLSGVRYLTVSHYGCIEKLKEKYPADILFFTVGMDMNHYPELPSRSELRDELGLRENDFIILSSSRLVPEKQIDKIILSIRSLVSHYPIKLIMTGHGPADYLVFLKQLVERYKLQNKVLFTGFIDETRLNKYFKASDVFFMGSEIEAGPLSTFIALRYNVPVISTSTGLGFELLQKYNAGIIVGPYSYKEWTTAIEKILKGYQPAGIPLHQLMAEVDSSINTERLKDFLNKAYSDFYE